MTRKLFIITLFLLLIVFVPTVNAQNATTGNIQTATDAASKLKQQMQLIQEQKKAAITQIKDEAKAIIKAKKEEFKTRIQIIKDQKKKALVERIDIKLATVNKKQTEKLTEILSRLQGFLDKVSKTATDTMLVSNISLAQTAIDTAKAAVETQTEKSYIMNIVDDTTLKLNAGTVVSQLRQDLTALHKLVIDAKQAVQKLNTDKTLIKKEATGSANL